MRTTSLGELSRGDTLDLTFTFSRPTPTVNLLAPGTTLEFFAWYKSDATETPVIEYTIDDGLTVNGAGSARLLTPSEDTEDLDVGALFAKLRLTEASGTKTSWKYSLRLES